MEPAKRAKGENDQQTRLHQLITLVGEFGEDKLATHLSKLMGELLKTEETDYVIETLSQR
jgi:hypothetical protein